MFPLKLEKLHSQVLPEVLPKKLVFRTPYFNSVRELKSIIQHLKPLMYKDEDAVSEVSSDTLAVRFVSKLSSFQCQINLAKTLYPLLKRQGLYGQRR